MDTNTKHLVEKSATDDDEGVISKCEDSALFSENVDTSGVSNTLKEFPYTGIFSPGGFLASLSEASIGNNIPFGINTSTHTITIPEKYSDISTNTIHCTKKEPGVGIVDSKSRRDSVAGSEDEDPSAIEIALSIHHIAHKIFARLPTRDLLNCRLVSYKWKIVSTPSLHLRIKLNASVFNCNCNAVRNQHQRSSVCHPPNCDCKHKRKKMYRKSLQKLLALVQQVDPPGTFPCTKFHLFTDIISNPILDIFLNEYGIFIDELSLTILTHPKHLPEDAVIQKLKHILTNQTPNIKFLFLALPSWKSLESADISGNGLSVISKKAEENLISGNPAGNTKLKSVKLGPNANRGVLEAIIKIAPNLKEVYLNKEDCDVYISHSNRLHLLKNLEFNPMNCRIDKLEQLAQFAITAAQKEGEPKLSLREINLDFVERSWNPEFLNPVFERRVVNALYDILQCNAFTLEVFSWDGMTLVKGIKFPKVMPKVHSIKLMNPHSLEYDFSGEDRNELPHLFPMGFSFAKTFPNLHSVDLHSTKWNANLQVFLTCLNFDPVSTVKKVGIYWERGFPVEEDVLRRVQKIFPNAEVKHFRNEIVYGGGDALDLSTTVFSTILG